MPAHFHLGAPGALIYLACLPSNRQKWPVAAMIRCAMARTVTGGVRRTIGAPPSRRNSGSGAACWCQQVPTEFRQSCHLSLSASKNIRRAHDWHDCSAPIWRSSLRTIGAALCSGPVCTTASAGMLSASRSGISRAEGHSSQTIPAPSGCWRCTRAVEYQSRSRNHFAFWSTLSATSASGRCRQLPRKIDIGTRLSFQLHCDMKCFGVRDGRYCNAVSRIQTVHSTPVARRCRRNHWETEQTDQTVRIQVCS